MEHCQGGYGLRALVVPPPLLTTSTAPYSGSPALLVGDSYLAFFHSSGRITHKSVITYVMGAYLFQR